LPTLSSSDLRELYAVISREVSRRGQISPLTRLKEWCERRDDTSYDFKVVNLEGVITCTLSVTHPEFGVAYGVYTADQKFGAKDVVTKRDLKYVKTGAADKILPVLAQYTVMPDKGQRKKSRPSPESLEDHLADSNASDML